MRASPGAGRRPALAFLAALVLAGCGSPSDTAAITALVDRFMTLVVSADEPVRSEDLDEIFTGLDSPDAPSPLEGLAPISPEASWVIQGVRYIPFGGAAVTVVLSSRGTTTTLEMRAKKAGEAWRLEPAFRAKQRLGEVRIPGS